jgi:hypothetical protein
MMRKRGLQDSEFEERETVVQGRAPVTIEELIKKDRTRLSVSAVFEAILIMMEIYVMFNMGEELIVIAIGLVPIAALLYLIISSAVDIEQLSKRQEEEKYDEIVRAQKASYLVIKRNFEDLQARMDDMEDASSFPADQIIGAQKAVAKVTITRNKENADALMNSNDMMIEQLQNMEDKLLSNNQEVLQKNQELLQKNQELLQKNQELESHINNLKAAISGIESKVNCLESKAAQPSVIINQAPAGTTAGPVAESVAPVKQAYTQPQMDYGNVAQPEVQESPVMEDEYKEPLLEESEISLDELEVDEPVMDESVLLDPVMEEPEYEIPTEDNMEDLATMMAAVDEAAGDEVAVDEVGEVADEAGEIEISELDPEIEAALAGIAEEPTLEEVAEEAAEEVAEEVAEEAAGESEEPVEELPAEELPLEELPLEELPIEEMPAEELPVEELPIEELPAEELSIEELPEEENGMEENVAEETAQAEATEAEPEENEIVPEIVQENSAEEAANVADVLAGLDTSDPNKVMSPDEIQALFANL